MLTTSSSFFFSICILSYAPLRQSYIPIPFQLHHRRILHQPFFPVEGSTPPSSPPSSSPSLPKFPSSTKTPPFFPFYPAPSPPPPAASLATFPANISSLDMPHNPSKKSFISAKTLVPILLSLLFLSLFIVFSLFFYRKHHKFTNKKRSRSNSRRLFPANGVASDGDKLGVSATSSEFLYLGTVVNSRRGDGEGDPENAARDSPYRKLGSPELHPLPPLARQSQQNYRNATGEGEEEEEDEEFYSPRGSLASKDSLTRTGSSSRRVFPVVDGEKIGGSSSNCSTRSYASSSSGSASVAQSSLPHPSKSPSPCPSSITSPQHLSSGSQSPLGISPERLPFIRFPNSVQNLSSIGTSPSLLPIQMSPKRLPFINSPNSIQNSNSNSNGASPLVLPISVKAESPPNIKSPDLGSKGIARDVEFLRPPPPPPPPLPPRQMTPSPPKQKTHSPSPPSSSIEKDLNKVPASAERIQDISDQIQQPAVRVGNLPKNQFSIPPPPPPPPPTAGFWDTPVARPPACWPTSRPPTLVTPSRIVESKNSVVVSPEKPGEENSDDEERNEETPRPKLKPLHWDKVRTSSDRAMVWDKMKSSSFQLNEEMVETLFVVNATNSNPKETNKQPVLPSPNQENRVLDPKKSQNIAILLRALNVTKEEVCEALLEGSTDSLGVELLETLLKMAPTKEEELKLKEYKDDSPMKLGPAESFLKAVLDIPFAFKRVDAMLYIANFDSEVNYLMNTFQTLEAACEELRSSRMFPKLLEAVLKTGNRMNVGTNRGDAHAFKLDTLLKLVDVKGTDGKTTLLHFVVQEISRSEGSRLSSTSQIPVTGKTSQSNLQDDVEFRKCGLEVVAGLGGELSNVKKAAAMDSDVLSSYVSKLSCGVGKIKEVMKLNVASRSQESTQEFSQAMNEFLKKAEEEIIRVQAQESVALSLVKEITEYFHGNSAKEEAHPFRIFMVVRDFLSILDQVCKEVAKINERTIVSSARQFPIPVNPMLPLVFPRLHIQKTESSDDEDSSLSSP